MVSGEHEPYRDPFIREPSTTRQFVLEEYSTGILPITKSEHFPIWFGFAQYSPYGFKFDTVDLWGIDDWIFHGKGKAYPQCGTYSYKGCLNDEAHAGQMPVKRFMHHCGRAECPVCSKIWLAATAEKIVHRINEAAKILRDYGWRRTRPIHVTVNPSPKHWSKFRDIENYNKLRRKAQILAKKAGFRGGSIIYHPYRERCARCGGKIKFKERYCEDCLQEDIVWYWSPHFHLFGFGWITGTRGISERYGWTIKNHGIRSDIGATAYYQLTHCGIHTGKQAVVWFGVLHYSKLKIDPPIQDVGASDCPLCGFRLRFVSYLGREPPPLAENEEIQIVGSTGWYYSRSRI